MATFLHRFMDLPPFSGPAPFVDLVAGSFYEEAVNWLFEAEITTGTSPTTFDPDEFVTRGQMATFLWRMCGQPEPGAPSAFVDVPRRGLLRTAVAWMAELGITTGVLPTHFAPLDRIRRGEMATFLYRLANHARGLDPRRSPVVSRRLVPRQFVGPRGQVVDRVAAPREHPTTPLVVALLDGIRDHRAPARVRRRSAASSVSRNAFVRPHRSSSSTW